MLPSTVTAKLKTSVKLNGLDIPFTAAVKSIARFCRPLAFHNEGSNYELSIAGSAFAVRVFGRNVLISSRHQFDVGGSPRHPSEAVVILNAEQGHIAVTCNEGIRINAGPAGAHVQQDIFALRFDDVREGRDLRPCFCRLDIDQFKDPVDLPAGAKVLAYVAIGYPSQHQIYDFEWDEDTASSAPGEIRSRWVQVYLEAAERNGWDSDGLAPFTLDAEQVKAIGDLDGLSGSPILMLYQDTELQAHIALAGMVLFASKSGRIKAYPGSRIGEALIELAKSER